MRNAYKFAALKLLFIFASIALNNAYFVGMKGENVGVAFINLACTSLVMYVERIVASGMCWTGVVGWRMLHYSLPDINLGIARNLKSGSR